MLRRDSSVCDLGRARKEQNLALMAELEASSIDESELEALWQRVNSFQMNDADAEYTFTNSLCDLASWDEAFANIAIQEYKKFMLLQQLCPKVILHPPQTVDTVWHLHILYTRSYQEFCHALGSGFIDHEPSKGGPEEEELHHQQFLETRKHYARIFGDAPEFIWGPKAITPLDLDSFLA